MREQIKLELQKTIQTIKNCLPTKKIYLFGSYAYGNPDSESDVDLCILADKLNERKIETIRRIRHSLSHEISSRSTSFFIQRLNLKKGQN